MLEQVEAASTTFKHTEAYGMAAKGTLAPGEHSFRTVAISAAFAAPRAETKQALHAQPLAETVGHRVGAVRATCVSRNYHVGALCFD